MSYSTYVLVVVHIPLTYSLKIDKTEDFDIKILRLISHKLCLHVISSQCYYCVKTYKFA